MMRFVVTLRTGALLWLLLPSLAAPTDGDELLARIGEHAARKAVAMERVNYLAESVTEIRAADGKAIRKVESLRRIFRQGKAPDRMEYLEMKIDGRALSKVEIEREVEKMKSESGGRSPFHPEEMPKYDFVPAGEAEIDGFPVYCMNYSPKKPDRRLCRGRAYIHRRDFDLVRLEFSSSQPPLGVERMHAVLNFRPRPDRCRGGLGDGASGFWIPADLAIDLRVKVAFIVTLADQGIEIRETYRDFQQPAEP